MDGDTRIPTTEHLDALEQPVARRASNLLPAFGSPAPETRTRNPTARTNGTLIHITTPGFTRSFAAPIHSCTKLLLSAAGPSASSRPRLANLLPESDQLHGTRGSLLHALDCAPGAPRIRCRITEIAAQRQCHGDDRETEGAKQNQAFSGSTHGPHLLALGHDSPPPSWPNVVTARPIARTPRQRIRGFVHSVHWAPAHRGP